MELVTPRLRIREFMQSDYSALREMDCRAEVHTYEREMPSEEETHTKLAEYLKTQRETPRTSFTLAITIHPYGTARGIVKMTRLWEAIREWEVGWMVHPDEWGNGYAGEAAQKVMNWAFKELSIHRIVAFCHADNYASVRVMEKLGMQLDGRLRETRWLNGKWWDELVYSMLEKEWLAADKLAQR